MAFFIVVLLLGALKVTRLTRLTLVCTQARDGWISCSSLSRYSNPTALLIALRVA